MLENAIVIVVVAAALVFVGRMLYRRFAGKSAGCCDSSCSTCPMPKDCASKREEH